MWRYEQGSGRLSHDGQHVAIGYSGFSIGKNNPGMQDRAGVGPLPQGAYAICPPFASLSTGPYAMRLRPLDGTVTFGRGDFEIHGDSREHPGAASHGCIILPRPIREQIWSSMDHSLTVTA